MGALDDAAAGGMSDPGSLSSQGGGSSRQPLPSSGAVEPSGRRPADGGGPGGGTAAPHALAPTADDRPDPMPTASRRAVVHALIEVIDHGQLRQSLAVRSWPVRIGRALDNDLVLGDPHVAAHHAAIGPTDAGGIELVVGDSRNGVVLGRRRLARGARTALSDAGDAPLELTLGRTLLRVRLAGQRVADEVPLAPETSLARRVLPAVAAGAVVVGGLVFQSWLSSDPESFVRNAGMASLSAVAGAGIWCGGWALLSKIVAHRARFEWHLRVFLYAGVALLAVTVLPKLLAFVFSWPWVSSYGFVGSIAVTAATFYFHLLAVEPVRRRWLKSAAVAFTVVGVLLSMWFNQQRNGQLGDELYMSHLFPPALRLARPVPVDRLIDGLAGLKAPLDKKAREPGDGSDGEGASDDE